MANFAVNCPDEVISRGNALIAKMAEGTDEKKAETLNRIFAIVEKSMDDVIMQENGIDTKGLDAALNDIRRMFQTASSNRERLLDEKEQQIIKLKMEKASLKSTFQNQLQAAMEEKEVAMQSAKKAEEDAKKKELLLTLKGKENVTKSGQKINLYANIGSTGDVANVLANDAEGIGLFRSEFVYLEKEDYPTEEEQFQVYKTVAQNMAGKKVIIRTLDIGADKQIDYFNMAHEENPAMGYRAIRICLDRPEVFKTQLRALFRASMFGNISIMYPMIISVTEVKQIKAIVAEVKAELKEQGIPFRDDVEQGIMIETPAAVMISDLLAKEVDFFSIGTNDLTQYTLAIDRQNAKLDSFYNPHHEAVLRLIQMTVENAHKAGIWAGICGELGADTTLTQRFLEMGVDELSVSPGCVLPVRKAIRDAE